MSSSVLYLLDTNVLVHFVRSSHLWTWIRGRYNLLATDPRPLISIVTQGELRSLALQYSWAAAKLNQMDFCLGYLKSVTIDDPAIIERYATIDAHFQNRGHILGKNDLWIAATAAATGAHLLTTDKDFDPLTPTFLEREWIDPNQSISTDI